jgi:hypothetical protein
MAKITQINFQKHISFLGQPLAGEKTSNMEFQHDSDGHSFSLITDQQAIAISQELNQGKHFLVLDFNHINDNHLALTSKILNNNGRYRLLGEPRDLFIMAAKQLVDFDGNNMRTALMLLEAIKIYLKINDQELAQLIDRLGILDENIVTDTIKEWNTLLLVTKLENTLVKKQTIPLRRKI